MTGTYIIPAIPPYCAEQRHRVSVVRWLGNRVLLQDEEQTAKMPNGNTYWIETDLDSFVPDIPPLDTTQRK